MIIAGKTDIGLQREHNEDCFYISPLLNTNTQWCVVCDGMGGANAGQVASHIAADFIRQYITDNYGNGLQVPELLTNAIVGANAQIYIDSKENKEHEGMGTTVVVAFFENGVVTIAHVGDSRAYLIAENQIAALTNDHSMVQNLIDDGKISEEEAKNHPQKNIITRAVGVSPTVDIDVTQRSVNQTEILLLCTDGLSGMVDDREILQIVSQNSIAQCPDALVKAANDNGGLDNITVVIATTKI